MIYISTFIPNTENSNLYEDYDYLFPCDCDVNEKECMITAQ